MKKDAVLDSFRRKCAELNLELLSDELIDGRALVSCKIHGGAWSASEQELGLKNKLANCADCFSKCLKDITKTD